MSLTEWIVWALVLFAQQFTFLFSSRAKNSGSLLYSFWAGCGSHSTWYFANLLFVGSVLQYRDAPILTQLGVCVFYVAFCQAGTQFAMRIARRIEKGKMRVGA